MKLPYWARDSWFLAYIAVSVLSISLALFVCVLVYEGFEETSIVSQHSEPSITTEFQSRMLQRNYGCSIQIDGKWLPTTAKYKHFEVNC